MESTDVKRLDRISAHLHALIHNEQPKPLDLSGEPKDELRQVGELVDTLVEAYRQRILGQNRELERLATTDPLTGVYNRRYFMNFSSKEFLRSQRYSHVFSVIQMDIDHFKKINETYGHAVGDEVLKAFTDNCQDVLRESDVFGRLGGEEFSVILPETEKEGALIVAERIRRSIAEMKVYVDDRIVHFTVSIGVSNLRQGDAGIEGVLRRADEALYLAKNGGRNKVVYAE